MTKQCLYIVDDDQAFCDSLGFMLGGSDYQLSVHTNPEEAIEVLTRVTTKQTACLLLDVRMPQMSGLELHERLRTAGVDIPIIYLTGHADVALAVEAMGKGALTFIEKPVQLEQLEQALKSAFSAGVQSRRQSTEYQLLAADRAATINSLTPREVEVLNGTLEGHSARHIGEQLCISRKTVEFHRIKIMAKLDAKNSSELHRIVAVNVLLRGEIISGT